MRCIAYVLRLINTNDENRSFYKTTSRWLYLSYLVPMLRFKWILAAALGAVFIRGLFIPVMDVDASQYASIAMEMFQHGSWLEVMHRHNDYLDKPPLLFWLSAISYYFLGINTWAYKLPSLLGALAGIYAVYRFSRLYYSASTAQAAGFILASSLGLILICNDVRTDTLLLGTTACTVWMLAAYLERRQWQWLIGAGFFTGLAMLAKGPIGAILPIAAIGAHLLMKREWRSIFQWQWLVALGVIGLVLTPMCIGLYYQFDLHPEKEINGRTGVSGLYFYFWEQSFGRITGENVWKNNTSVFYFTHVLAWAALPWTLIFITAFVGQIRALIARRFKIVGREEGFSIGALVLIFIALSLSKYKLPHYIFIVLPWVSVITARYLMEGDKLPVQVLRWAQNIVLTLLVAAVLLIPGWMFFTQFIWIWLPILALLAWIIATLILKAPANTKLYKVSLICAALIGFVLNFHFYPTILSYQTTSTAGAYLRKKGIPANQLAVMGYGGHALDFYAQTIIPFIPTAEEAAEKARKEGGLWVYAREGGKEQLDAAGIKYEIDTTLGHFQAALLKYRFLNPATRVESLTPVVILKIE